MVCRRQQGQGCQELERAGSVEYYEKGEHMSITRRIAALVLFSLVMGLSGLFVDDTVAHAQDKVALGLDHFKCYFTRGQLINASVFLKDQFDAAAGIAEDADVLLAVRFCNPVEKTHHGKVTPILNPNAHLKLYLIATSEEPTTRTVVVSNQFRPHQKLTVFDAEVLGVPTQKLPLPPPTKLDHFKCYRATGESLHTTVDLKDQFHREEQVPVLEPFGFCNPVEKLHSGVPTVPIQNRQAHLVCYKIATLPFIQTVFAVNQFGRETLVVRRADLLCVPSLKLSVTP